MIETNITIMTTCARQTPMNWRKPVIKDFEKGEGWTMVKERRKPYVDKHRDTITNARKNNYGGNKMMRKVVPATKPAPSYDEMFPTLVGMGKSTNTTTIMDWDKVGKTLETTEDIKELKKFNKPIFYDGKFFDIKNTLTDITKDVDEFSIDSNGEPCIPRGAPGGKYGPPPKSWGDYCCDSDEE